MYNTATWYIIAIWYEHTPQDVAFKIKMAPDCVQLQMTTVAFIYP